MYVIPDTGHNSDRHLVIDSIGAEVLVTKERELKSDVS